MLSILARTIIIYAFLLLAIRISGKRQIGELQLSELITTLMLSELAVVPISNPSVPLYASFLPILILLCLEYIISLLVSRLPTLRRFFFGAPSVLILNGELNIRELRKVRLGVGELLSELRLKNISDIGDVQCAILEDNGQLSVFPFSDAAPLTPRNCCLKTPERGVAFPVIISGSVMHDSMKYAGVDSAWLDDVLRRHSLTAGNILLMTVDQQNGMIYILDNKSNGKIYHIKENRA